MFFNQVKDEITKMSKENYDENIMNFISNLFSYNRDGFLHITKLSNLRNIYEHGMIYSRRNAEGKNIIEYDNKKYNELTDICLEKTNNFYKSAARFYLKKNAPAIYKFDCSNSCILICDYRILFDNTLDTYISIGKAFNKPRIYKVSSECKKLLELPLKYVYRNDCMNSSVKDYNSSEFLCKEAVPIKYIKQIIFRNEKDLEWFNDNFKEWINERNIVDKSYFGGNYYDNYN